jgi:predicted small secreted protein
MKKMLLISIALTMLMIFAACQNTIKDTNSTGNAPLYTQTVTAPVNPQAEFHLTGV